MTPPSSELPSIPPLASVLNRPPLYWASKNISRRHVQYDPPPPPFKLPSPSFAWRLEAFTPPRVFFGEPLRPNPTPPTHNTNEVLSFPGPPRNAHRVSEVFRVSPPPTCPFAVLFTFPPQRLPSHFALAERYYLSGVSRLC